MATKTARIREALAAAPGKRLTLPALMEAAEINGRASAENICVYLRNKGEVAIHRDCDPIEIELVAGKPARKAPAKRPKKAAKKKRAPARLTYKTLRKRLHQPAAPSVADLALDNYLAIAAELRRTVGQQVEGIENDPALAAAIDNHDRAAALLQATRPA